MLLTGTTNPVSVSLQCPGFQAERSESEQGSSWGSSPLTDSASPRLDHGDSPDSSCIYRQLPDSRSLCHSLQGKQLRVHAQGQGCQHGRCEAGRYFLGAPPSGREAWWGGALTRSSLEKHEGWHRTLVHIRAAHGYRGENRCNGTL